VEMGSTLRASHEHYKAVRKSRRGRLEGEVGDVTGRGIGRAMVTWFAGEGRRWKPQLWTRCA